VRHVIEGFCASGGHHCITNAIKQVFHFKGHRLSEEMIFGLAAGLHFFYFEFKNTPYPLIGGRCKIGDFEETLASNLGIIIETHRTTSSRKAYEAVRELIARDEPVVVYVDMNPLSYLGMPEESHFGGHAVVIFGIDEEEGVAYVSDRDSNGNRITLNPDEKPLDFHKVSLDELVKARGSTYRPFPPQNRWLTFDLSGMWPVQSQIVFDAIRETCTVMRCSPIRNLGLKGIQHFSRKVREWREFDEQKLKWSSFNAYIMINAIGGTGGGAFRRMYGTFLKECAALLDIGDLERLGSEYITLSEWWDDVADTLLAIGRKDMVARLDEVSESLEHIHQKEESFIGQLCNLVQE